MRGEQAVRRRVRADNGNAVPPSLGGASANDGLVVAVAVAVFGLDACAVSAAVTEHLVEGPVPACPVSASQTQQ